MNLVERLLAWLAGVFSRLPKPESHRVEVERNIGIPLPDGVTLEADRLYPKAVPLDQCPAVLMTTCYERKGERVAGRVVAKHGYQVVIVSSRGTCGSGGEFRPVFNEQADARAVVNWITDQPWFSGSIGAMGGSYLCISHWGLGIEPPEQVKAFGTAVMSSSIPDSVLYRGGAFGLGFALKWTAMLAEQRRQATSLRDRVDKVVGGRARQRRLEAALTTLPLSDTDLVATGTHQAPFQEWLSYESADNPAWAGIKFRRDLDRMPPMSMVAGWYDGYFAEQLADFAALQEAGRDVRILVGPCGHGGAVVRYMLRDQIEWLGVHLKGQPRPARQPVRVFVMGEKRWAEFPSWPPPADLTRWHLHPAGRLTDDPAPHGPADRYRYDPADPTPMVGGATLYSKVAGAKDNREVEARADVLTYTSDELSSELTVIGPVAAELHVRSSLDHTDFFARLCDVHPDGKSINLCDGLVRMEPERIDRVSDGSFKVRIDMAATANTFRRGHRIRLQVSSGAHPVYARNPGSGEPLGKATTLLVANQEILHGPDHVSFVELPVRSM